MCEPQELQLEPEPATPHRASVRQDDLQQQLEGIRQLLLALRQEVSETRQQLAHMQTQVSTLYGLSHAIGPHHMGGFLEGTWVVYVLLTPWRWVFLRLRRGKQILAKLQLLRPWSTFYWVLFAWVLWRGRMRRFVQRRRHLP